uniref:Uncharacterized protein n=1 Tax=Euplotes crassus TaxID=5936 RepID=A0A7S3KML6_EUPCR|mmetsp:Transcript_35571/g.35209  ORF Transcript_35571/g.35209 Transcript_35571/m.35209 type:complete len:534 (+) Transcript_35571:856-2457(+)
MAKLFPEEIPAYKNILLTTIRCPKNLMYLTDRLPNSCYYEDSMNGSEAKTMSKSHHGLSNQGGDMKHSITYIGSKKTKASSSNDSQYMLPKIGKNGRNKVASLSKDHSGVILKKRVSVKKGSKNDIESHNLSQEAAAKRISTISPEVDGYENDFESEKEVKVHKTPIKGKDSSPRILKENESKIGVNSNSAGDQRKTPHARRSEVPNKEEKKRDPHYINISNQNKDSLSPMKPTKGMYLKGTDIGNKPSQRFAKNNLKEEYKNNHSSSGESLLLKGNNANSYMIKRKINKSNLMDNSKNSTMENPKQKYTLRNGRKREKARLADRKHSNIYIEKNLSYSPSMIRGIGKSSHTPSLLIRNNLKNIDKVSPYKHTSKNRHLYNGNYSIINSRHHSEDNHKMDYLKDRKYHDDSLYKNMINSKERKPQWKIDKKKNPLGSGSKFSSIISRNAGAKIRLPNLNNNGNNSDRTSLSIMSSNLSQKYKYDILNIKGNPYYPVKNTIHKSRNMNIYNSNSEIQGSDVIGKRLGISKKKLI